MYHRQSKPSHQVQMQAISDNEQTTLLAPLSHVSHRDIARRAFAIFQARGSQHGQDVQDWLAADKELIAERGLKQFVSHGLHHVPSF